MFYAIEVPNSFGASSWVVTRGGKYQGMGNRPSLFSNRDEALDVMEEYKKLSRSAGKHPSHMRLVKMGVVE